MKYLAAFAIGTSVLAPLGAQAGGMAQPVIEPAVMAPVAVATRPDGNWTGFYGGLSLGYGDVGSTGNVLNGSGEIGGILAGYRYDFGSWVGGVEADYDAANIDLAGGTGSLNNVGRLKFQVGADLGKTLVYATAGWAHGDATVGAASLSDSGYFGGIGIDYAVAANWIVGGEVLVHQFDDFDNSGISVDATTVKARVAYRF